MCWRCVAQFAPPVDVARVVESAMLLRLLLLFTLVPLIEFALLVQVERFIGLLGTLALILATGALGAVLARREGLRTLQDLKLQTRAGLPSQSLVEGVLVLVAAAVLLTPGLLTDACGFLLLAPAVRRSVATWAIAGFKARMAAAVTKQAAAFRDSLQTAAASRGDVIDVEFEPVERKPGLN